MADIDFKKIVEDAGIPTTEAGWKALFLQDVEAEGSSINNSSSYSPFWRLVSSMIAKPAVWVINNVLIAKVMPNMFLKTATDRDFIETKVEEYGVTPKEQSKLLGKIRFNRAASAGPGLLIEADTVIQTDAINGTVYRVLVTEDTLIPQDATTYLVPVAAEFAGAAYNLAGGYFHILPEALTGIGSVTNDDDWIDTAGADAETNDELKERARNAFTAAAPWHIDAVYRAMLTERAGINTDNVYFEHDAPRGPGTANVYILLDSGEPSAAMLTDLNNYLNAAGYHGHGDDMQVLAMPSTTVDITLTVYPRDDLLDSEITALFGDGETEGNIANLIRCAFRENTDYSDVTTQTKPLSRFSFSRLGQELHEQFDGIDSINWGTADITSALDIPRINTLTITNGAAV